MPLKPQRTKLASADLVNYCTAKNVDISVFLTLVCDAPVMCVSAS